MGLCLYPSPPTDWSTLYASLKILQGINNFVTRSKRTIITLDLQLCSKCLQLRQDREIDENFIFCLGELDAIFAMLKVVGKYTENNGLDFLFLKSRSYGETALKQILQDKDEAWDWNEYIHALALTWICFREWLISSRKYKGVINEIMTMAKEVRQLEYTDQHT